MADIGMSNLGVGAGAKTRLTKALADAKKRLTTASGLNPKSKDEQLLLARLTAVARCLVESVKNVFKNLRYSKMAPRIEDWQEGNDNDITELRGIINSKRRGLMQPMLLTTAAPTCAARMAPRSALRQPCRRPSPLVSTSEWVHDCGSENSAVAEISAASVFLAPDGVVKE